MQSEERMQSFGLHFLDERMQKLFLLGGIVTKSSVFYYSLRINAKMQREKYAKTDLNQCYFLCKKCPRRSNRRGRFFRGTIVPPEIVRKI